MNWDDRLTTIVYFSEALQTRYPDVFKPAKLALESNGIEVRLVKHTQNIWVRDYFPLQVRDHYVRFSYKTVGYDKWPQMKVSERAWNGICPIIESPIILDGGNCQRLGDVAIITEIVFKHNPKWIPKKLLNELERLLECRVILIPAEPGDDLGHSDGIVKFIDEKTVLVNDYSSIFEKDPRFIKYMERLSKILENSGYTVETLPFGYDDWDWNMSEKEFRKQYLEADDFNPGPGYYVNFLLVAGLILLPVMRKPKDVEVMRKMRALYPGFNIVPIDCSKLSMEGGLMACVSANYMK
jgi:agmatine deiminase